MGVSNFFIKYKQTISSPNSNYYFITLTITALVLLIVPLLILSVAFSFPLVKSTKQNNHISTFNDTGKVLGTQPEYSFTDDWNVSLSYPEAAIYSPEIDIIAGLGELKEGFKFVSYKIEYGLGSSPSEWSTKGITLVDGGKNPKVGGRKRATWDTSKLKANQVYSLRMIVKTNDGRSVQVSRELIVDRDVLPGWPKNLQVYNDHGTPIAADLDNDGHKEIVLINSKHLESTGRSQEKIFAFKKDGSSLEGWPVTLPQITSTEVREYDELSAGTGSSLAITNLIGDKKKEVVARNGEKIIVLNSKGKTLSGWPQSVPHLKSTVSVGDLDGDGSKEIVVLATDYSADNNFLKIYVFNDDGTLVAGFPKTIFKKEKKLQKFAQNTVYDINLVDLDNDKKKEIVFHPKFYKHDTIYILNYKGNNLTGWPKTIKGFEIYRTVVGDITGDGEKEIIAYYSEPLKEVEPNSLKRGDTYVSAFNKKGEVIEGYPIKSAQAVKNMGPTLADVSGDGVLDVVIPSFRIYKEDVPYKYSPIAISKGNFEVLSCCNYQHDNLQAVVDFNGDGEPNIIATSRGTDIIHVLKKYTATDGKNRWSPIWQKKAGDFKGQPIVTDLDNNGKWDIITTVAYGVSSFILVWEPKNNNFVNGLPWDQYLKDEARTSTYISTTKKVDYDSEKDTEPPSTPTDLKAEIVELNKIDLSWGASLDNTGVTDYEILRDNIKIANTANTKYLDETVQSDTTYKYQVIAIDLAGNASEPSEILSVSTPDEPEERFLQVNQNMTIGLLLVLIVIFIIGFSWWWKRKKRKIKTETKPNYNKLL